MQSITIQFLKYNRKPWQSYMNSAESIENQFFFFFEGQRRYITRSYIFDN